MLSLLQRLRPQNTKELYFLLVAFVMPLQSVQVIRKGISIFHVINIVILGLYLLTFFLQGRRIRWYLLLPIWIFFVGSLLGMFNSQVLGLNLYTLAQDVYLYVWFVAMCLLVTSQRDLEYLANAWVVASILVVVAGLFLPSGGINSRDEFTFRNPNRASAYFLTTCFLLFSPAFRGRPLVRLAIAALLGWAVFSTGSLGTFASFAIGTAVMVSIYLYIRGSGFWIPRQVGLLLVAGVLAYGSVIYDVDTLLKQKFPLAFGRAPRSIAVRQEIWNRGLQEFREHPFGIGPASFFGQVESEIGARGSIELHSDYVATLVERGVVGFLGLVVMFIIVGRFLLQMVRDARRLQRQDLALWVGAISGLIVAYFSYSLTHEALHHDTLWMSLALLVAQWQILRRQVEPVRAARPAQAMPLSVALPRRA
jgi:O-antigen ligase